MSVRKNGIDPSDELYAHFKSGLGEQRQFDSDLVCIYQKAIACSVMAIDGVLFLWDSVLLCIVDRALLYICVRACARVCV